MTTRVASCSCGQLTATCEGDPVRVSVCHCLDCQRRTGSAFAAQARFPMERVTMTGAFSTWTRVADSGRSTQRFCPTCGSTLVYDNDLFPGRLAIPLGAFGDPAFPPPRFSVYESRRHPWTTVGGPEVEHHD